MPDLVLDARYPGPLSIDARYPGALTFDAVVSTAGAPPGDGWALDFSNSTYSGLAALIFEDF